MKVCVYTPLNRLAIPSGVPRHIVEMVNGLMRDESLKIGFIANRDEVKTYLRQYAPAWADLPITTFNRPSAMMHRRWGLLNTPAFEDMGGDADWLYLPADGYVPTRRARLAVTIHDIYKLEPPVPFENRLAHYQARLRHWVIYKRVAARAERILTVSEFTAGRIMHHLGVPASRITVVYNGVSEAFFAPNVTTCVALKERLGITAPKYFVYAGGLKAKKNGSGIIQTWQEIERRRNDCQLVILGYHDPTQLNEAKRKLSSAVFPPRITDEEMATLLHHSVALFFPSFYEGFGIPLVEAMAAGTLVVASDIPALREVGCDVALYVDPREPCSMADALERCLALEDERTDRIAAGRQLASKYVWPACVGRLRSALEQ